MLDRSKPFAEICGGFSPAKYIQNDKLFDAQGNEIKEEQKKKPKTEDK